MGEAGDLLETRVGDLGVAQAQLDQAVDSGNRSQGRVGHFGTLQTEVGFLPGHSDGNRARFNPDLGKGRDSRSLRGSRLILLGQLRQRRHWASRAGGVDGRRSRGRHGGCQYDSLWPLGALFDPFPELGPDGFRQRTTLRRHQLVVVLGQKHAVDDFTLVRVSGHHRRLVALASLEGGLLGIHPILALLFLGAVALETMLGEDRGDILGKIDGGLSREGREACRCNGGREDLHTNSVDEQFW